MMYAYDPYFCNSHRIDEQFSVGQQFSTKSELKLKIADFHVQQNIELEITNSNKSKLVMECKYFNCPWRIYATPNITGI
jgi:MuDR family transposase